MKTTLQDNLPEEVRHRPRRHAAARTREYIYAQLIPYLGNKRKLLPLIGRGILLTGTGGGTFVDLFAGSTVVARLAKTMGYRTVANDWEPYAHQLAAGTVAPNRRPEFAALGGAERVFETLNALPPLEDYVARHLCPADDDRPDPDGERMFFTRENGLRIDAIREQIARWETQGLLTLTERAYVLAALLYAVSYVSNTSGVFKGFHRGWGGKTATALYRIRSRLRLDLPVLHDNGQENLALCQDAQVLAGRLTELLGAGADVAYVDPPYNQHPYGSNYHVLNTVALWDKPPLAQRGYSRQRHDKSAIRTDWRSLRRSPYNYAAKAAGAFAELIGSVQARWVLVSYSTDGIIPPAGILLPMARRGTLRVLTQKYKRYRVSTPRRSPKGHNVEFLAVLDTAGAPEPASVARLVDSIQSQEAHALPGSDGRHGTRPAGL